MGEGKLMETHGLLLLFAKQKLWIVHKFKFLHYEIDLIWLEVHAFCFGLKLVYFISF